VFPVRYEISDLEEIQGLKEGTIFLTPTTEFLFSLYKKQEYNDHDSAGLRPEKGCAGDSQEQLKSTDLTSRQRGYPTSTNP
jgi:hypothetical protein